METAAPQDPPVEPKPTSDEQMNDSTSAAIASATPQPGMLDTADDEGAINEAGGGSTTANNTNSFTSPPNNQNNDGLGSGIRPIFMGNLSHSALSSDVEHMFRNPVSRGSSYGTNGEEKEEGMASEIAPFDLDRVDMKRGYCFVFMQEPKTIEEKNRLEAYVGEINGMNINNVSNALRAEFARGDGRVKRKEDERRKKISPSETLFVVNFHEETTKREDLQMLFEPYGRLVRIEMKRNYAFVQFETVEEASRAKDATNGGKLDQSEITVEFVARRMGEGGGRERGRRDDYRGGRGGGYRGDRYDERRDRGGRRDDRGGYRGDRDRDYRRRSRSRSRSPGYRRRSPPRYSRRSRSRSPGYRGSGRDYDDRRTSDRGGSRDYDRGYERSERGYGDGGR